MRLIWMDGNTWIMGPHFSLDRMYTICTVVLFQMKWGCTSRALVIVELKYFYFCQVYWTYLRAAYEYPLLKGRQIVESLWNEGKVILFKYVEHIFLAKWTRFQVFSEKVWRWWLSFPFTRNATTCSRKREQWTM
jgi:hypothetical protein